MSLQLDDDLLGILIHTTDTPVTESWALKTIVKLVIDNQQLRKLVRVTKALEPDAQLSTSVNQAAKNPRTIIECYDNMFPAVGKFTSSEGSSNAGSGFSKQKD